MRFLRADTAPAALRQFARRNLCHTLARPIAWPLLRWRARHGYDGVARLDGVLVLNLASRIDRLASFESEARRLGLNYERFEAIEARPGILGCTLSHAAMLRAALERGWDTAMICEDDALFQVTRPELDCLISTFLEDQEAEVACLAFTNLAWPSWRNALFLRTHASHNTGCYLVKRSIIADLVEVFEHGARGLAESGDRWQYGVDRVWQPMQAQRVFLVPFVRAVIYADGWSDIEDAQVSYRV